MKYHKRKKFDYLIKHETNGYILCYSKKVQTNIYEHTYRLHQARVRKQEAPQGVAGGGRECGCTYSTDFHLFGKPILEL
jgi:hypothetical protein